MTKLTKTDIALRDEVANRLQDKYGELTAAIEAYNNAIQELWGPVEVAMNEYNEAIGDANAWKTDRAQEMQEYIDERSEKWQESDKASEYETWKSQYEEDFEQVELEAPEGLSDGDVEDYSQLLWELPEGVSQ